MSENQLYDAALAGNTTLLGALLQQDPFLLERVSYNCPDKTPLHVATIKAHSTFVAEVLDRAPHLARQLDAGKSSPLHIAAADGHVEIVRRLLLAAPGMCLSRDGQFRNPAHLAAMNGHVAVLSELAEKFPAAVREKDGNGNTVLHIGVDARQVEVVEYLARISDVNLHAKNTEGLTPVAMLDQCIPRDATSSRIKNILTSKLHDSGYAKNQPVKWLTKKRDAIMVVAILIATMAFQVGVNPPGGVWQDDSGPDSNGLYPHRAGEAIIAHNHPKSFKAFMRVNTIAFIASLSTILLLISGLPFRRRLFMWVLMVIMWLTITSTAATYAIAIAVVTPGKDRKSFNHVTEIALVVWCSVMLILFVGNTVRLVDRWLQKRGVVLWRPKMPKNLSEVSHV
ncbi:ankyrin repeat-containing protein ITN1-like [Andrographis paniculata]|uniref:ankyrin repeat-containing protein ITN1-like n=1 Tax=Andrographis paniculata TaxID=175694 RepID=UPI0021E781FF|nr:ankyrin repeat-containing protein ITN1-like [Andrographis paniculata]